MADKDESYSAKEIKQAGGLDKFLAKVNRQSPDRLPTQEEARLSSRSTSPVPAPSIAPIQSEHDCQRALLKYFQDRQSVHPEFVLVYAVPNAGKRASGGWSVAEGLKAGVPDLCWPIPSLHFHGLYVELKRADGGAGASNPQKAWLNALKHMNYRVALCNGVDEALAVFEEHFLGYQAVMDFYDLNRQHGACLALIEAIKPKSKKERRKRP